MEKYLVYDGQRPALYRLFADNRGESLINRSRKIVTIQTEVAAGN